MDFYTEPERKIEIADRADVLVAGGGPAGYSAAIAALPTETARRKLRGEFIFGRNR